jgi:uncharacterized membrane protein
MARKRQETVVCQICGQAKKPADVLPAELIRAPIVEVIRRSHPQWDPAGFICAEDLGRYRAEYIQKVVETDRGELSEPEEQVVRSLREHDILARNVNVEFERQLTFGERLSDRIAEFGGSWRFIIIFGSVLLGWIALNSAVLLFRPFDPYPYILLNLVLSCLAAIQAPIIMMSQNRQEDRDRLRAEHDYRVNLKAELEIRHLHEKVDHLLMRQWQRLLEIQEVQVELMEELSRRRR